METLPYVPQTKIPWNKGKIVGQKPALKLKEVWAIRTRLQMEKKVKELALFNMAIDSLGLDFHTLIERVYSFFTVV